MTNRYRVHSVHKTTVPVKATTADGHEVDGQMPTAVIELVAANGSAPSVTVHRQIPTPDASAAVDTEFPLDSKVEMGAFTPTVAVKAAKEGK